MRSCTLGSVRPTSVQRIDNVEAFADNGAWLSAESRVNSGGRYAEPRIAELLGERICYFGRAYGDQRDCDTRRLRAAVETARERFGFDTIMLVDGGGDSLVLQSSDANHGSCVFVWSCLFDCRICFAVGSMSWFHT